MYCKNDNSQLSMTKTPVVSSGHLHFYWMFQCAPGWDPRLLIEMMVTSPRSSDRFMFWLRFIHMTICGWTIYSFNPKDSSRMIQLNMQHGQSPHFSILNIPMVFQSPVSSRLDAGEFPTLIYGFFQTTLNPHLFLVNTWWNLECLPIKYPLAVWHGHRTSPWK